jgi:hypothetical protein
VAIAATEADLDHEEPLKLMDNDYLIATKKQFETRVSCTEGKKTKSADEPETNEGLGDKVYEEEHD